MSRLGWLCLLLGISAAVALEASVDLSAPLESDDIIQKINNEQTTWKAGRNFDPSLTKSYLRHLLGALKRPGGSRLPTLPDSDEDDRLELPASFDARQKWSGCKGLTSVRDQGPCGSCWAVGAASSCSDRLCIATNGAFNGQLSTQNLLSCCDSCGNGCEGGYPEAAMAYIKNTGLCTGGDFKSHEGCQPYTLPTCEHHTSGSRKNCSDYGMKPTPKCKHQCYNKRYKEHKYAVDLHRAQDVFVITNNVKQMQNEIFKNGPVESSFDVYEDFLSYKSGVYGHKYGELLGGHAVRVIGWGEENNTPYWLVSNSWNTDWGDLGYFKIKKGNNECGFEGDVTGCHM